MSISTMTTMAYQRQAGARAAGTGSGAQERAVAVTASPADTVPTTQTGVASALSTVTAYIPTEILITYVAVAAALTGAAATSAVGPWLNFFGFLVATPIVVWLIYAGNFRTSGESLPRGVHQWPSWEMIAATIGYIAWAFALPGTPFAQFGWYNAGVAGVAVLVAATGLGLLTPLASRRPAATTSTTVVPATSPAVSASMASPTVATVAGPVSMTVPGFTPGQNGLQFRNAFPHEALISIPIPGMKLALGDAANGLCGGMVFTVRDLFEASVVPPPDLVPPAAGTPRFEYLVERQIASLDFGAVALRLYELGSPLLPDGAWAVQPHEGFEMGPRGRSQVMVLDEWPAIRSEIDSGHPSVLGLVRVIDTDPRVLGHDHQVLAYGYAIEGDTLAISIYDPNHPDENVTLSLSLKDPSEPIAVSYSAGDGPVFCFIHIPYQAVDPTPWRPS